MAAAAMSQLHRAARGEGTKPVLRVLPLPMCPWDSRPLQESLQPSHSRHGAVTGLWGLGLQPEAFWVLLALRLLLKARLQWAQTQGSAECWTHLCLQELRLLGPLGLL